MTSKFMPPPDAFFEPLGACRDVEEFEKLNRIGEGTYGTVYRARDRKSSQIVALKRVLLHNEASEGFPITALREIKVLKRLRHPNCVQLLDVAVGRKRSSVFLVFEYCEHDLSVLLRHQRSLHKAFKESEVSSISTAPDHLTSSFTPVLLQIKRMMLSILHAVNSMHQQNLLHRDIKLSNVLYDRYGCVKLADFGLARETRRHESLTPKVVTLWYRAPEILLGDDKYSSSVDMWACGCIFGELLLQEPLMPGQNELEQLEHIYRLLGRPNDHIWPGMSLLPNMSMISFDTARYSYNNLRRVLSDISEKGIDLMNRLLTYDPVKRISAKEALSHPYFREKPFPQESYMMPTFPSLHPDMKDPTSNNTQQTRGVYRQQDNARFGRAFDGTSGPPAEKRKRL